MAKKEYEPIDFEEDSHELDKLLEDIENMSVGEIIVVAAVHTTTQGSIGKLRFRSNISRRDTVILVDVVPSNVPREINLFITCEQMKR